MMSSKHSDRPRVGLASRRSRPAKPAVAAGKAAISGAAAGHDVLRGGHAAPRHAAMPTAAGLWIDHRKAVIVVLSATGDVISEIRSAVEREPSRFAGVQSTASHEARLVQADDRRQRAFTGHMARYYDQVASALGGTGDLLILGPGEAKGEFRKHLEHGGRTGGSIAIEAAGGLSRRQIMAKVRTHFLVSGAPAAPPSRAIPADRRAPRR